MHRTRILAGAGALALGTSMFGLATASATAPPPTLQVSPTAVTPGQTLTFTAYCAGNAGAVTSAGLTAPVSLSRTTDNYTGSGKAAGKPGRYRATFTCSGSAGPAGNGTVTVEFSISCTAPAPSKPSTTRPAPPTTSTTPGEPPASSATTAPSASHAASVQCVQPPPSTGGGAPQVKVRPKGAPETGDGTTSA
ncbi:hypothetical protein [Amycolatopsis thermophila]|uniref:Ig-like domain-containing protein n=1 Tax=Amycolatopsis thermophila TaxID=206084 RepID=A0ABU0F0G5_9PSEU|nr:hypothetical protein [Amycolatopsis thermophila]MDQ0381062.1 hypothetical protein [Amycolatopsis thermophila]